MELSFPSLFACSLSLSVFIIIFYFLSTSCILKNIGIVSVYLFALFIIVRGFLPFDFKIMHLTKTYASTNIIPHIQELIGTSVIQHKEHNITFISILLIIWVSVGVFLLSKNFLGYFRYQRKLKQMPCTSSKELKNIFDSAYNFVFPEAKYNCKILVFDGLTTPAVFGILHPIILIPSIPYTEEELYYIFVHELLHIKYKDFIIKSLSDIIAAMHWWNPLISFLYPTLLRQIQELHVDHIVTRHLQKEEKYPYLDCLYKTLKYTSYSKKNRSNKTYALCDAMSQNKFRQRLDFIMYAQARTLSPIAVLCSLCLLVLSFTFVFEALHMPDYSETGRKVFYPDKNKSYFLRNGSEYDLFLNGEYVYTTPTIPSSLEDLPLYDDISD